MSIAADKTRIEEAKAAIASAIAAKGTTVPQGTKLDGLAALVGDITAAAFLTAAYESAFPAAARENTLGVITNGAIGAVTLAPDEPSEPANGDVWIKCAPTGNTALTVLASPRVLVWPIVAYQRENSLWQEKTAKLYSSGAWQALRYYFYFGAQGINRSGGFVSMNVGSCAESDGRLEFTSYSTAAGYCRSRNTVDLTNVSAVKLLVLVTGGTQGTVGVGASTAASLAASQKVGAGAQWQEVSVDVSALTGSHYIMIAAQSKTQTVKISQIYLA